MIKESERTGIQSASSMLSFTSPVCASIGSICRKSRLFVDFRNTFGAMNGYDSSGKNASKLKRDLSYEAKLRQASPTYFGSRSATSIYMHISVYLSSAFLIFFGESPSDI